MIAGTLAVLREPVDEEIDHYSESGRRAIEVEETQSTFEDTVVQRGMVAGRVPTNRETVTINGHSIDVETRETNHTVASEWVADAAGAGWICAESTHSTGEEHLPPWPFSTFQRRLGTAVEPVEVDPGAFAEAQEEAGRETDVEFVGKTAGQESTSIEWGKGATQSRATSADVGVALTTFWDGNFVRAIVYASGFVAVWEPEDWTASAFARFVTEEVLPVAYVPDDDEDGEQSTLDESARSDDREGSADD